MAFVPPVPILRSTRDPTLSEQRAAEEVPPARAARRPPSPRLRSRPAPTLSEQRAAEGVPHRRAHRGRRLRVVADMGARGDPSVPLQPPPPAPGLEDPDGPAL